MGNPRRTNGARRTATLKWLRSLRMDCWICGLPIDYGLPARHPLSFECDEIVPVSKGGSPYARDNVAPAHRCCNGWRSAKPAALVETIRAIAASRFGAWTSPEQFVSLAKSVEANGNQLSRAAVRRVETSTDW